jgi:predicted DCC family thiol-disulfide oxidoreductase YuxK
VEDCVARFWFEEYKELVMSNWRVKLLYDGDCAFCRREIAWLKRRDREGRLALEDISALGFDPARYGLSWQEVRGVLHGVLPDGRIVRRVEAIRQAYRAVGLGWLAAPTRLPVVSWLLDCAYGTFARNRTRLGQMFDTSCKGVACAAKSAPSRRISPIGSPRR